MTVRVRDGQPLSGTTAQRPTNGEPGDRFYDTTLGVMYVWTGTAWVTPGNVVAEERTFTETGGAGTYTASVALPAGATLIDIIVNGVALWDNAGAVTMIVGDGTDPDGYFTAVNLKATDLLAGESISTALAGGKAGAYIANSQVSPRYAAAARSVIGVVTTASTAGSTGRTRMTVIYAVPGVSTAAVFAA